MKYLLLLIFVLPLLNGCGDSADASTTTKQSNGLEPCLGFAQPSLMVNVLESQNSKLINTARVDVYFIDESVDSSEAIFDNLKETYYSDLEGFNGEQLGLVVSETDHHTFVTRNLGFTLDTSCGASNEWIVTVYLCPIGTTCI